MEHRGALAGEIIRYDTVIVDMCHYIFAKTHGMHNTKSEPGCKLCISVKNNVSILAHQ